VGGIVGVGTVGHESPGEITFMSQTDRRQIERLDLQVPALLQPSASDSRAPSRFLLTRDISSKGAYFQTSEPYPHEGSVQVKLILKVPACNQQMKYMCLTTAGEVMRREATGFAIRFEDDYTLLALP
jgi:hypothetical protein